jgi:hypothetical protein
VSERWLPVRGWPAYEVSSQGRVRSVPRVTQHRHRLQGKVLRPSMRKYPLVNLSAGAAQSFYVHTLVLEAFVGPCPPRKEACHNNGNYQDNRLKNLRWDTRSANAIDRVRQGNNSRPKLNRKAVLRLRKSTASAAAVAAAEGITEGYVRDIRSRRAWRFV